jgi:hypothetical protein
MWNGLRSKTGKCRKQLHSTEEETQKEKIMNIYASSHPDYFSITPGISIGQGWIMIDWMWWVVDITTYSLP